MPDVLDQRDVDRSRYGLLPIFVSEPRKLTDAELDSMWGEGVRPSYCARFEAFVQDGFVVWKPRT